MGRILRASPWSTGTDILLNIDQIIPTKDVEEFIIGLATKSLDEVEAANEEKNRHKVRRQFWAELLKSAAVRTPRFQNISPGKQHWINAGSGVRGVPYQFVAGQSYARVELYIDRGDKIENKAIFDELLTQRRSIEDSFGEPLVWERLDDARASRIKRETIGNMFDQSQWPELIEFMTASMSKLENSLKEPLKKIQQKLQSKGQEEV
ncbi:DUF4268 domain-containing protein [Bradyrhizobium diazoefficiens]